MFAVVRHPDIAEPGIVPQGAIDLLVVNGWYRVSDWRPQPSDFHLPDFTAATKAAVFVCAPESEPEPEQVPSDETTEEN